MITNLNTKHKIEQAKEMMKIGKEFSPTEYEKARYTWEYATPTWSTIKKYADEIGLIAVDKTFIWHSDGSLLAEMIAPNLEGTVCHYTMYYFAN